MRERYKDFDANVEAYHIIAWIKDRFSDVGRGKKAILGISGGKDSTVAAALCAKALGPENVIGVIMPDGEMNPDDYQSAIEICTYLGITYHVVNIGEATDALYAAVMNSSDVEYNPHNYYGVITNTPARIRMTTLYMFAMMNDGLVINTCNASEDYIGYSTKYGDAAGDISPLGEYTATEIFEIGDALELPTTLVHRIPSDGMCGCSDEENFGFTYAELDDYIRNDVLPEDVDILASIKRMNKISRHKYRLIPTCKPEMFNMDFNF